MMTSHCFVPNTKGWGSWLLALLLCFSLMGCPKEDTIQPVKRVSLFRLMRQLRSGPTAASRIQAAKAIGKQGSKAQRALPALRRALKDRDPDVRRAAVQAMRAMGTTGTPSLIEAATSEDKVVQDEARRVLTFANGENKTKILRKALEHPFWKVRASAAQVLGELKKEGADASVDIAILLNDREPDVRKAAAIALRNIGPPEATQPNIIGALGKALPKSNNWWEVQIEIAKTLGSFGAKGAKASSELLDLLQSKDKQVQEAGASALYNVGPAALPALQTALGAAPWQAKIWVTKILGRMGKKALPAVPALVDALGDNDIDVRKGALLTLNNLGASAVSAMPKLLKIIKSTKLPRHIWEGALQCIFSIGNQGTLGLLSLLESDDWAIRRKIMENIGRLGARVGPQAVPFLTQALGHKQKEVRWTSAMVLSKLGRSASPAVSALVQTLDDKDPITRKWSARALGAIGPKARSAIGALEKRKSDIDPAVQNAVIDALKILKK